MSVGRHGENLQHLARSPSNHPTAQAAQPADQLEIFESAKKGIKVRFLRNITYYSLIGGQIVSNIRAVKKNAAGALLQ